MLLPEKFCVDRGAHQFLLRSPRTTVDAIWYNQWTVQLYRTDDERDEWTSTCVQVDVVTMAYLNWWWIFCDHPDPIVDGVPDDWRWSSTTTRTWAVWQLQRLCSLIPLLLLLQSTWRRKPATVINSIGVLGVTRTATLDAVRHPCKYHISVHVMCTSRTTTSLFRASADIHGTYCYVVSYPCIFCSFVVIHGMYHLAVPCSIHPSCTVPTTSSCRRDSYIVCNHIVFLCGRNRAVDIPLLRMSTTCIKWPCWPIPYLTVRTVATTPACERLWTVTTCIALTIIHSPGNEQYPVLPATEELDYEKDTNISEFFTLLFFPGTRELRTLATTELKRSQSWHWQLCQYVSWTE